MNPPINRSTSSDYSDLSQDHIAAGINWISGISSSEKWNLTIKETVELLGVISPEKYYDIQRKAANGLPLSLDRDTFVRISLLLGIWRALQIIVPKNREDLAYSWFHQANTNHVFEGKSIKQYLLDRKSIEALHVVRRYLDAACMQAKL